MGSVAVGQTRIQGKMKRGQRLETYIKVEVKLGLVLTGKA